MTSLLVKTAMAGTFALPVIVGLSAPAHAETNPYCSSGVTQIGTTAYVNSGGQTFASVKQFKALLTAACRSPVRADTRKGRGIIGFPSCVHHPGG